MFLKRFGLMMSLVFLSNCVHLNSVSLTPIPAERQAVVRAESSKVVVFGLSFSNDYVDTVRDELRSQCPKGKVTGILTKDEAINYFLWIVYKRRVEAQGYCLKAQGAKA